MSDQPPDDLLPSPLPTGTVTFLFTDIEDSTLLVQQLGERYAQVQRDQQAILRAVWATHAGVEVDTQGDSFFVAFTRATDALAAAIEAQRALAAHGWPAGAQVRVRMGMHTGSGVLASPRQYIGLDVIRAARIAAAGHGGQILLSQATRDQVAKELVAGAGLRDLGRHRLKGLTRREEIYQLVLPGLPTSFPPLKTLDAWPGYRADLVAALLISSVLLAAVGLALPGFVPGFPRGIGLGAGLAALVLLASAAAPPVRRALAGQWRDARKPVATATSALLSLVVILTTLSVTKPPVIIKPLPNPFTYTYHAPTHIGGAITVGVAQPELCTLAPFGLFGPPCYFQGEEFLGLWQSCLMQLPDASLGLDSFKPDQCKRVPTIDNGDEDPNGRWTILHLDPRAVWSDGMPVTADDYLFTQHLYADPNFAGTIVNPAYTLMHLTALDLHTIKIDWSSPYGDYLFQLTELWPLPLHVYATGPYAGIYNPRTGVYNSKLAQALLASPSYTTTIPVDDGPFTVQSFVPNDHAVLIRNPRFFSNFFHHPAALDQITLVSALRDFPAKEVQAFKVQPGLIPSTLAQQRQDLIAQYQKGEVQVVDSLTSDELPQLGGIPAREKITSPAGFFVDYFFNQRSTAPNASANGGTSLFTDPAVRKAFVQAFDRCAAVRALLSLPNCTDSSLFTDELTAPPSPDYDPTFKLPPYDPVAAAAALDHAGYPVGADGIRRAKDGKTLLQLVLAVNVLADQWSSLAVRMQQDWQRILHVRVTLVRHVEPGDPNNPLTGGGADIWFDFPTITMDPTGTLLTLGGGWDRADIPSPQNPTGQNVFGLIDPHVVDRSQLGSMILDQAQRNVLYKSLQRYVSGLLDIVPTSYDVADVALVKPTLCNYKKSATLGVGSNLWNVADWYVAPACPD